MEKLIESRGQYDELRYKVGEELRTIQNVKDLLGGDCIKEEYNKYIKALHALKRAEQIVLSRVCSELKKEYDQYNQLMEEIYDEELLPATIPELLISSVKRATAEMHEINKNLQHTKEVLNTHV